MHKTSSPRGTRMFRTTQRKKTKEDPFMARAKAGNGKKKEAPKKTPVKYSQFLVTLPLGEREKVSEYALRLGYRSRNEFVVAAIREMMNNIKNGNLASEDEMFN